MGPRLGAPPPPPLQPPLHPPPPPPLKSALPGWILPRRQTRVSVRPLQSPKHSARCPSPLEKVLLGHPQHAHLLVSPLYRTHFDPPTYLPRKAFLRSALPRRLLRGLSLSRRGVPTSWHGNSNYAKRCCSSNKHSRRNNNSNNNGKVALVSACNSRRPDNLSVPAFAPPAGTDD